MKIITLGYCCSKSKLNHKNACLAAKLCNEDEPLNISDFAEISKYGIMSTPAIVINNKVVSSGRLLTVDEIKKFIMENK